MEHGPAVDPCPCPVRIRRMRRRAAHRSAPGTNPGVRSVPCRVLCSVLGSLTFVAGCTGSDVVAPPASSTATTDATTTSTTTTIPATTYTTTTIPATTSTTTTSTTTTIPATTSTTTTSTTTTSTTTTIPTTTIPTTSSTTTVASATSPAPGATGSIRDIRPASDIPPPPVPAGWVVEAIGTSVRGRQIVSWSRRVAQPRRTVVVIGAVHGNEPASPPSVRALVEVAYPDDVEIWLVPELNPDGVAAGTRWNANGVDLNRNFPWGWRADDGGPAPLSEPEARAAADLVGWLRPDVVVWVHQPYGYVTSVGGSDDLHERAWSVGSGLPVRPDVTQHGGAESWSHFTAGLDSVLVEIDTWAATPEIVAAQRRGFEQLLASLG
jgi:protein MpaA